MAEKTQTWKEYFADKSDDWLKDYAQSLHFTIYDVESFGTHDLVAYDAVLEELDKRGFEAVSGVSFRVKDNEGGE